MTKLIGFSTTRTFRSKDHRYYSTRDNDNSPKEALHAYKRENPRKRRVYPVYIETEGDYRMFSEPALSIAQAEALLNPGGDEKQ